MAEASEKYEKAIVLTQRWGSGKLPIGSQFKLRDTDRIMTLIEADGYPHGKFVFDDGEEFDVGKYFDFFFSEKEKEIPTDLNPSEDDYDEDLWDKLDDVYNPKKSNGEDLSGGSIRKTFVEEIKIDKKFFENIPVFDVTSIVREIVHNPFSIKGQKLEIELLKYAVEDYPDFTREKLKELFLYCNYEDTENPNVIILNKNNERQGLLFCVGEKLLFAPKNKIYDEYFYQSNTEIGFFNTADSYFDVALDTIKKYKNQFLRESTKGSYGYQANSTVKTLLAFACECYLKSLLLADGKDLDEIKKMGHGLSVLYTSLDDNAQADIFSIMERSNYGKREEITNYSYEALNLSDKFMLDLARVDDAFVDSRYCAEKDKNIDYFFLYQMASALRIFAQKHRHLTSPFSENIQSNLKQ